MTAPTSSASRRGPGVLLGAGLGAFADGIVLHQILQWHNMLSARIPPVTLEAMSYNMRWDGLFHVLAWGLTLLGAWRLWRAALEGSAPRGGGRLAGDLFLGAGLFNIVEGLVDHQILGIHHVRETADRLAYDLGFLLIAGIGFVVLGLALGRRDRGRAERAG